MTEDYSWFGTGVRREVDRVFDKYRDALKTQLERLDLRRDAAYDAVSKVKSLPELTALLAGIESELADQFQYSISNRQTRYELPNALERNLLIYLYGHRHLQSTISKTLGMMKIDGNTLRLIQSRFSDYISILPGEDEWRIKIFLSERGEDFVRETIPQQDLPPDSSLVGIDELLPRRASNTLARHGLSAVADLLFVDEHELLVMRNFGKRALELVKKLAESSGISLGKYKL